MNEYPTSIGTADANSIKLLGHDLAADLMGQVDLRRAGFLAGGAAPSRPR